MPSRTLTAVWAALDFCLMASGVVCIAFSLIWRAPNLVRDLTISHMDLNAGLILGIMLEIAFVISLFAITQSKPLTSGFRLFNWALVADSIAIIVVGAIVWFYTLEERAEYQEVWLQRAVSIQIQLQDKFSCCGYFQGTNIALGGDFCSAIVAASSQPGCVNAITSAADYTLNNIFTTIYGFIAITLSLFLASVCQINKRLEEERFRRIDEKRGGRGFV